MGRETTRRKPGDLPVTICIKLSGKKVWVWVFHTFFPFLIMYVTVRAVIKNVLLK